MLPGAENQDASSPANQAQTPLSSSAAAASDIDMSPLTIGRSPAEDEELDISGTPSYLDGVPRDAAGIPLITPATVTVARGGQHNSATLRCAAPPSPLSLEHTLTPSPLGLVEMSWLDNGCKMISVCIKED